MYAKTYEGTYTKKHAQYIAVFVYENVSGFSSLYSQQSAVSSPEVAVFAFTKALKIKILISP